MWLKLTLSGLFLFSVFTAAGAQEAPAKKIRVVTTIFPLYDFVRQTGGDRVEVESLIPPGVEPHDFDARPSDIERINAADIFIYTSDEMEPWASRFLPLITNQNLMIMAAVNSLSPAERSDDPHIWLDFGHDIKIIEDIKDNLIAVDDSQKELFEANAKRYQEQLQSLDEAYRSGLALCVSKTVFYGGHSAFEYLARRYGLSLASPYRGFAPDAEPSAMAVGRLVSEMRAERAKVIFYEELIDPKIAKVVGEETGARPVLLSAAHNVTAEELNAGVTFIAIMEDNLQKLKEGLRCP